MHLLNERVLGRLRGDRPPYSISNKAGDGGPAVIRLYEEIGIWGVTEEEFASELDSVTATKIEVQISSPGGDVFSGIAIYNALRAHPAHITTRVDSLAASIASVIVQAGDHRVMLTASQQMIHPAWALVAGPAAAMRKMAALLDRQSDVIAGIYADRSGRSKAALLKLMDAETWFTAREAVTAGLADEVISPSKNGPEDGLSDEQRAVLVAAQWSVWQGELENIAQRIALDEAEEQFEKSLTTDSRPPVDYTEVAARHVDEKVRALAESTRRAAVADLGVSPPEIRWCRPAQRGEPVAFTNTPIWGLADRQTGLIWLRSSLSARLIVSTVAHEVAHFAGMREIDASNYGHRYEME